MKGKKMRITKKMLDRKVQTINRLTSSPTEYAARQPDGSLKCNAGHYCLSSAYGGHSLERISTDGGGVTCPIKTGHVPARELNMALDGFIAGIRAVA